MSGPTATCYKREGTKAWFYSRKGAWNYPTDIKNYDPTQVIPGHKYELDFSTRPLTIVADLGQNQYYLQDLQEHGLGSSQNAQEPISSHTPSYQPPQPQRAPDKPWEEWSPPYDAKAKPSYKDFNMYATAGFKSALEGGREPKVAQKIGLEWARFLLGDDAVPPRMLDWLERNDDIPF